MTISDNQWHLERRWSSVPPPSLLQYHYDNDDQERRQKSMRSWNLQSTVRCFIAAAFPPCSGRYVHENTSLVTYKAKHHWFCKKGVKVWFRGCFYVLDKFYPVRYLKLDFSFLVNVRVFLWVVVSDPYHHAGGCPWSFITAASSSSSASS